MNGFTLCLALVVSPAAGEEAPASWRDVAGRLERSVLRSDGPEIQQSRAVLEAALKDAPAAEADLVRYTIAYAHYHLAVVPSLSADEQARQLDEAAKVLKKVVEDAPRFAEAHALLGSVYGLQIGRSPFKGMVLGPKADTAMDRAAALEPDNPRIVLQQAVAAFHKPKAYGGSPVKAEALLTRALALFEREGDQRPWPNWGRADAHAWLGQVLAKRGDRAGAKAEYQRALALAPEFGWVRHVLLPAVE